MRLLFLLSFIPTLAMAQFNNGWLQSPYWRDGKAEFDIYSAREVRYGAPHESEVIHILVQEPFSGLERVKTEDASSQGAYQVLKMNQIVRVPTGIYVYQQMQSNFWSVADGRLIKFSFTSNDSCGNTYKEGSSAENKRWIYEYRTYWEGMSAGEATLDAPANGYFYDELPMRIRTIDFTADAGEFEITLAETMIRSKADSFTFEPAKVQWKREADKITVTVTRQGKVDQFQLSPKFPFLLKQWSKSDGSSLELKEALKLPYWEYNKPGDRERALEEGRKEMRKWTEN